NVFDGIVGTEVVGRRQPRRRTNWKWVAIGLPSMIFPPVGVWFLFRKGFGFAWAWILAPVGILLSAMTLMLARKGGGGSEFFAGFGFSILPLSIAALASYYRAPGRATWALAGVALGNKGDGLGQLLYLFSGVAVIVAAVSFAAARFPRFAPAFKMGVAYPLSNRFRTGMTIAMFSLIIFSLTVFSIINANLAAKTAGKTADGRWH